MQKQRIPVQAPDGKPLMPTSPARARKWVESGKAVGRWSKLGVWFVQLVTEPSGRAVQKITAGIDPGKLFSGLAVQSARFTLFMAHAVLPFKRVKERKEFQRLMRRGRRGRRINRKVAFHLRAHRQKRFNNRRQKGVPPSIRANRQLELRILSELLKLYPIQTVVYEYVKAKTVKGCSFSPVQVGQRWMLQQLSQLGISVETRYGWETAQIRRELGIEKSKNKAEQTPASHAVDGVALACSQFIRYQSTSQSSMDWVGSVTVTDSQFVIVKRPPISRRQLNLAQPRKGGLRRKYGGTITRHNELRKGDFVKAEKKGETFYGYVSGDTKTQVSVSDHNWRRLAQFSAKKIQLVHRATGIICSVA